MCSECRFGLKLRLSVSHFATAPETAFPRTRTHPQWLHTHTLFHTPVLPVQASFHSLPFTQWCIDALCSSSHCFTRCTHCNHCEIPCLVWGAPIHRTLSCLCDCCRVCRCFSLCVSLCVCLCVCVYSWKPKQRPLTWATTPTDKQWDVCIVCVCIFHHPLTAAACPCTYRMCFSSLLAVLLFCLAPLVVDW